MRELNLGHFAGGCSAAPWAVLGAKGPEVRHGNGELLRCTGRAPKRARARNEHRFCHPHSAVTSCERTRARGERSEPRRGGRGAVSAGCAGAPLPPRRSESVGAPPSGFGAPTPKQTPHLVASH